MKLRILTLIFILTILKFTKCEHAIQNCVTQASNCCSKCKDTFFVAKCQCISENGNIKFFAKMNEFIFLLFFIILPISLITLFYLKTKAKGYSEIIEAAKIDRRGAPVMFDDQEIHSKLDRITEKPKDDADAVEMENGKELENPLTEDGDD